MTDEPESGVHPKNKLNSLSGKEWLYFLASVEGTAYPVSGPESYGHALRRVHPSPKPPQLMRRLMEFFTKPGGWVLDPFCGVGGTLLGASLCGRNAVGIDLEPEFLNVYRLVCGAEGLAPQISVEGDARHLAEMPEVAGRQYDLILTDPPYAGMMTRLQSGEKKKKTGLDAPTPFTQSSMDLGNLPYAEFVSVLRDIISSALPLLKSKGHLVVFTKDLQPTVEHHNMLHADIVTSFRQISGLRYRGCKIWYDKTVNLYPFGYPHAFVANQLHQYILIFRKETS
ncbi:MAG TPA: DNA methyltransferase [Armatimonadota bacterium]|jgi:DNA modification methylase